LLRRARLNGAHHLRHALQVGAARIAAIVGGRAAASATVSCSEPVRFAGI
jgi:hypothetical protein